MQRVMKRTVSAFCSFIIFLNVLQAASVEDQKKAEMIQDLEVIKHHFEVGYAPAIWKKEYADWDLNQAFEQSKNKILSTPSITTKQFQQVVRDFVKTMKDYHVGVLFYSTERASLPFSVKGVEGRYFIDWIDPFRLPAAYSSIRVGDELLEFDGRPITEVIAELAQQSGKSSNLQTDQAFAEMKLTIRVGFAGDDVPKKGTVLVTTRSAKTEKIMTNQLRWLYTAEYIKNPLDFRDFLNCISFLHPKAKIEFPKIEMANPLHQSYAEKYPDRPGGLGGRKSFLPPLGAILWSHDNVKEEKNEDSEKKKNEERKIPFWHAYIYQHPQGHKIGYIRIPHYAVLSDDLEEFGEILNFLEKNTDGLVIDQLHNFGGYVYTVYKLASMLTQQPLQTPYHRIKISQEEAMIAYQILELIKLLELRIEMEEEDSQDSSDSQNNQEQDKEKNSSDSNEDKLDYQQILFFKDYFELILEEWNNGHTLTRPTPITGVDKINPHPKYHYTKPILMLINEMDFSGGDFMPAILQDNKRVVLFGTRTAGAGGFVQSFQFPNTHGIASCSYTASIAERSNLQKIENLGVTPDIECQLTIDDMLNGYRGYIEAVNQSIQTLVGDVLNRKSNPNVKESLELEEVLMENSSERDSAPEKEHVGTF